MVYGIWKQASGEFTKVWKSYEDIHLGKEPSQVCDKAARIFSEINVREFSRERDLVSFSDASPPGDRKLYLQQWDSSDVVGRLSCAHIIKGAVPFP